MKDKEGPFMFAITLICICLIGWSIFVSKKKELMLQSTDCCVDPRYSREVIGGEKSRTKKWDYTAPIKPIPDRGGGGGSSPTAKSLPFSTTTIRIGHRRKKRMNQTPIEQIKGILKEKKLKGLIAIKNETGTFQWYFVGGEHGEALDLVNSIRKGILGKLNEEPKPSPMAPEGKEE